MNIKRHNDSHLDHSLTEDQIKWVLGQEAPAGELRIQTLELPEHLGTVPCGLIGPVMGDEPVPESEVEYLTRGERKGQSRIMRDGLACFDYEPHRTRQVTIISGPHGDDPCILYTAFGGPAAPREPFEFAEDDQGEEATASRVFWAQHALLK